MTQGSLFHDSFEDALTAVITALGGSKKVGSQLWPEKSADDAGRLLKHCLNPDRAEKLSAEQIELIGREARKVGSHDLMLYLCRSWGYSDPTPIEPEDERARLQRDYVEAVKHLSVLTARIERAGL